MAKKKETKERVDGLGPDDLKKIHSAVRKVWAWSHARRLAVKRATDKEGFPFCEKCGIRVPKHVIDHIEPVGQVGGPDYIQKMFVPSTQLQCLCKACHAPKTRAERKVKVKKDDDINWWG